MYCCFSVIAFCGPRGGIKSRLANRIHSYHKVQRAETLIRGTFVLIVLCCRPAVPLLRRSPHQTQRGDRGQRRAAHHQKEGRLRQPVRELRPPTSSHALDTLIMIAASH